MTAQIVPSIIAAAIGGILIGLELACWFARRARK